MVVTLATMKKLEQRIAIGKGNCWELSGKINKDKAGK